MSWFSPFSVEQRQRRNALREARELLRKHGGRADEVDADEIVRIAEFILKPIHPESDSIDHDPQP